MLDRLKIIKSYFNKNVKMSEDINEYLRPDYKIYPRFESLRIAVIYGVVGALWILLSDELLSRIFTTIDLYKRAATYKGWGYVAMTMLLIYFLVAKRLNLLQKALDKIYDNFEELRFAHEKLIALEEELRHQLAQLDIHRNALSVSEQRYRLAVEGADCGIWDWDVEHHIYYFAEKWKNYLGYKSDELSNTFEAWMSLLHPDEKEAVIKKIRDYMVSKITSYEDVYRMRCKDGTYKWVLSKGKAIWSLDGKVIRIAGSHTDITEQKKIEEELNALVYYDTLTQLSNRLSFELRAIEIIGQKSITEGKFALIYMDIDNFKNINDTLGHFSGDKLLKHVSGILQEHIKAPSLAARLGGDEFVIILEDVFDKEQTAERVQTLLKYLRKPWYIENIEFFISFSIGIAMYPEDGNSLELLLRRADMAMYTVKKHMKDSYAFYNTKMEEQNVRNVTMVNELRQAVEHEEFEVYYQPIISLQTGKIAAVEALVRWIHPEKGIISPMNFIPIAEETGLIYNIGSWVLRTAFMQKKVWGEQGYPDIRMSINVSGKRITQYKLVDELKSVVAKTGVRCEEIQLEVTETAVMDDIDTSVRVLNEIKEMGIKIALDDFGTGYSSLTYLNKLPIDIVKLDRSFIRNITSKKQDHLIVEAIIKLTHDLGLTIVAEGIETNEQLAFLKVNKCNYGQGYLYSKPIPKDKFEKYLSEK